MDKKPWKSAYDQTQREFTKLLVMLRASSRQNLTENEFALVFWQFQLISQCGFCLCRQKHDPVGYSRYIKGYDTHPCTHCWSVWMFHARCRLHSHKELWGLLTSSIGRRMHRKTFIALIEQSSQDLKQLWREDK